MANSPDRAPYHFSLKTLFFVLTLGVGFALFLSKRYFLGIAVYALSAFIYHEDKRKSLDRPREMRQEALKELMFGLFVLLSAIILKQVSPDRDFDALFFTAALILLIGLARFGWARILRRGQPCSDAHTEESNL